MKKQIRKIFAAATAVTLLVTAVTGCDSKPTKGESGSKTVEVKLYKAGYGEDWLNEAIRQFEETYKSEGYKIKITEASNNASGIAMEQEIMLGPNKNDVDLYITSGVNIPNVISGSSKVLRTQDETLLETLDDVLESKPIGKDKKEEKISVGEKMSGGFTENLSYDGNLEKWNGKHFVMPWATGGTGLIANKKVLDSYGIAIPNTTDELVAAIKTVAQKSKSSGVYPYAWAGNNAPGYWSYLFETWFAQYSGCDAFKNFWATTPDSGDIKNDGWKVYGDKGILESLTVFEKIMNLDYSVNGSVNATHLEAQHNFLTDKAAFIVSGDWMLNEMKNEYKNEASAVIMVKTPILSSIGSEIGVSDAKLSQIVSLIDKAKSDADIKSEVPGVTDEGIKRVRSARTVYSSIGNTHQLLIPSYSDAKDVAKLFIRFLASDSGAEIFRDNAFAATPYVTEIKSGDTEFQKSCHAYYNSKDSVAIFADINKSEVRSKAGMLEFNYNAFSSPNTFKAMMTDKKLTAKYIYETESSYVKANWDTYISYAGM